MATMKNTREGECIGAYVDEIVIVSPPDVVEKEILRKVVEGDHVLHTLRGEDCDRLVQRHASFLLQEVNPSLITLLFLSSLLLPLFSFAADTVSLVPPYVPTGTLIWHTTCKKVSATHLGGGQPWRHFVRCCFADEFK